MNVSVDQLVPPNLPQMDLDGVIDQADLYAGNGVIIEIGASAHASKGDYMTLLWAGIKIAELYVETDNPASFFPWITIVPAVATPDGSYSVSYTRKDQAGNVLSSPVVTAVVQRNATGTLPPPTFPEAINGVLTDTVTEDGTTIAVPAYPQIAEGDQVMVTWVGSDYQGHTIPESVSVANHTVSKDELSTGFTVVVGAEDISVIGSGQATAWYSVQHTAGGLAETSQRATVQIGGTPVTLPGPVFPEATNGGITADEAADGTLVQISYSAMATGDRVEFNWQGYASNLITPVAGTSYSEPRTVTALEAQAQQLLITVPAQNILPIGNGFAVGWYQVNFIDGGVAKSTSTQAVIVTENINPFQISTTTGAPYWSTPSDIVRPYNVVTVAGAPGTQVEIALSSGDDAWFSDGLKRWTGTLTQTGYVSLSVYSMSVGVVEVSAYDINDVSSYGSRNMIFNNYTPGNGDLLGYGHSTGAPANGDTANSLYAKASDNPNITRVVFNVTGSANIVGYGKTAILNLSDSRTASVNVVDSTPEKSTFTINALQSSTPSSVDGQIEFITFPL